MLSVLLIVIAAGLVVVSVVTDSLILAIAGLVVAVVALGLMVWPVLMARRAAAVAAEDREEAATATEQPAAVEEPAPADETPTVDETSAADEPTAEEPASEEPASEEPVPGDTRVLVVPGRHRYHRAGCTMLDGREPETLDLEEAREEGFTACSRCLGVHSAGPVS